MEFVFFLIEQLLPLVSLSCRTLPVFLNIFLKLNVIDILGWISDRMGEWF